MMFTYVRLMSGPGTTSSAASQRPGGWLALYRPPPLV